VTYSRNVFIPVTDLCRNLCGYCTFCRPLKEARLVARSEAVDLLERAAAAGCSEALFSMGDRPWEVTGSSALIGQREDLLDYLVELAELALDRGLLPHTNAGLLQEEEIAALAPYNASMGLMLETTAQVDLHRMSPGKSPSVRLAMMEAAGRQKVPFTSGILVGIGEDCMDRIRSLELLADLHRRHGNLQEVILQPLDPKPGTPSACLDPPSLREMSDLVGMARAILPAEVSIQVPPNLVDPRPLIQAGADDLGGLSPISQDHINPNRPWPRLDDLLRMVGRPVRERLPIYPSYVRRGWYGRRTRKVVLDLADRDGFRRSEGYRGSSQGISRRIG